MITIKKKKKTIKPGGCQPRRALQNFSEDGLEPHMETRIVSGEALSPYANSAIQRFREPSEKIRTLAAISLSKKVAYLRLSDLVDSNEQDKLQPISDGLASRVFS